MRPSVWWLFVVIPMLIGALTAYRDEFATENLQQRLRLQTFLPSWSWWQWVILGLVLSVFLMVESAYRLLREKEQQYEQDGRRLKKEYDENLYKVVAHQAPADLPVVNVRAFTQPGYLCCAGNIEVLNSSHYPIRCYAVGELVDGTIQVRNKNVEYDIRWEHVGTPYADIQAGTMKRLNVVAWGRPRIASFIPFGLQPCLVFLMAEKSGIRGTTKVGYFTEACGESAPVPEKDGVPIALTLEVRLKAEYLGHPEKFTPETRRYLVRPGRNLSEIGFGQVAAATNLPPI